jgi:Tfp pilus assembly protein PilO
VTTVLNNRRAPLLAGVGVGVLVILLIVLLVLPKMGEVSEAEEVFDAARAQQQTLQSQKEALEDAEEQAPLNEDAIAQAEALIPPIADEGALFLVIENAALAAGIDTITTVSVGNPVFDPETGLSTMSVSVQASGTYFEAADFLYRIETLPRAAVATSLALAPGEVGTLTIGLDLNVFTSDSSAGPGSAPGETTGSGEGNA